MQTCNCKEGESIFLVDQTTTFKTDAICIRCGKNFEFYPEDKLETNNISCPKSYFDFLKWEFNYLMEENLSDEEVSYAILVRIAEIYQMYLDKFSVYLFSDVRDAIAVVIRTEMFLAYEKNIVYFGKVREALFESTKLNLNLLASAARYLKEGFGYSKEKLIELFGPLAEETCYMKYTADDYEKTVRNFVFSYIIQVFHDDKNLKKLEGYILTFCKVDRNDPLGSKCAQEQVLKALSKQKQKIIPLDEAILMAIKR